MDSRLEEILNKLCLKAGLIWKLEHRLGTTEIIKVHTLTKTYSFAYYPNKDLQMFVEKGGFYEDVKLIKKNASYEEFDKIFMTLLDVMYKKWGCVLIYDMVASKKTVAYPLPCL